MYDFEHEFFFGKDDAATGAAPDHEFLHIDARGRAHRPERPLTWRDIVLGWTPALLVALSFAILLTPSLARLRIVEPFLFLGLFFSPLGLVLTAAIGLSQVGQARTPDMRIAAGLGSATSILCLMKLLPIWFFFVQFRGLLPGGRW